MTPHELNNLIRYMAGLWPDMATTPETIELWKSRLGWCEYEKARAALDSHKVESRFRDPAIGAVLGKLSGGKSRHTGYISWVGGLREQYGMDSDTPTEAVLETHFYRTMTHPKADRTRVFGEAVHAAFEYMTRDLDSAINLAVHWTGGDDKWLAEYHAGKLRQEQRAAEWEKARLAGVPFSKFMRGMFKPPREPRPTAAEVTAKLDEQDRRWERMVERIIAGKQAADA